jgi:hypothetical protein
VHRHTHRPATSTWPGQPQTGASPQRPGQRPFRCHVSIPPKDWSRWPARRAASQTRIDAAASGHQREFRGSGSGRLDGEARQPDVLTPANWAGRGPVEAVPLSEDEAAAETPGRLDAQPLPRRPDRASDVGEGVGDLLLRNPDETRELMGGARALAEVAEKRFTDGDRALRRWALALRRGHVARVLHFVPIGRRSPDDRDTRRAHAVIGWHEFCMLLDRSICCRSTRQFAAGGRVLALRCRPPTPFAGPGGGAMVPAAAEGRAHGDAAGQFAYGRARKLTLASPVSEVEEVS